MQGKINQQGLLAMQEKRGSAYLRQIDHYVGAVILLALNLVLSIKRTFWATKSKKKPDHGAVLLVCFGAIGDLIVLTTAARQQLAGRSVYLACSKLNYPCAKLYADVYADIAVLDVRNLLAVHRACERFGISQIMDSTQWANIGPIQVGLASLLGKTLFTSGFQTQSALRNRVYDQVIPHARDLHEVANFINLMAGAQCITGNAHLPAYLPALYQASKKTLNRVHPKTDKVLLHLWPSGNRAYLKAWPEAYWLELAQFLSSQGYEIYLSGAPSDQTRTEHFCEQARLAGINHIHSIAGKYDLGALKQFMQEQIEWAVSVNTGILHLLVDAGVPVIGLHGGVNPQRWGPLGSESISLLPQSGKSAYLHYGFEYPKNDTDAYSLDKLTVQQVIEATAVLKTL